MKPLEPGDYVLATKYRDGDPGDQFAVGFYHGRFRDRYLVADADGKLFRANGFRRIATISKERGDWLVAHVPEIEAGRHSVWWWKRCNMDVVSDSLDAPRRQL
jgi:hypothetical protein